MPNATRLTKLKDARLRFQNAHARKILTADRTAASLVVPSATTTAISNVGMVLAKKHRLHSRKKPAMQLRLYRSVRIGNIEKKLRNDLTEAQRANIPSGYLDVVWQDAVSRSHLQWLMQKDHLGQDSILVGNESVHQRRVALAYAELTQRPVEVLVISSDTTESDLKQRRVLEHGSGDLGTPTIRFIDQAPVRAARKGHILLLDGLEHAERNVLASLNNLLENREMPLEDGRFLGRKEDGLPVHDDFRVVALYNASGSADAALDPPVRSRFSIRRVDAPIQKDPQNSLLQQSLPNISTHALLHLQRVQKVFPNQSFHDLVARIYPYRDKSSKRTIDHVSAELEYDRVGETSYILKDSSIVKESPMELNLSFRSRNGVDAQMSHVRAKCGGQTPKHHPEYLATSQSEAALGLMLQEHVVGRDILLLSPKGHGKSVLAKQFCSVLGYQVHLFALYKEMTATDLLIRRASGDEYSPLLKAAVSGQVCILDGIEKVSPDTLASLQSLLTDRHVWLPDGTQLSVSNGEIQPSFRVVALASSSTPSAPKFMTPGVAGMFSHILLPNHTTETLETILKDKATSLARLDQLLQFHRLLTKAPEDSELLSLRTMRRIVLQTNSWNLYESISDCLRKDLLPSFRRHRLESSLESAGITKLSKSNTKDVLDILVDESWLKIGDFSMRRKNHSHLVPDPYFFDIPSHVQMIQRLLREWAQGERAFLLLGNQGTGKNKICDRLCQLANMEREYLQLHRDSTIGQLTLTPSLENGKIVWKDSALVRSVVHGRALVIDEADKAPLEVVAVLKSLVEDGELLLADGRRIVRNPDMEDDSSKYCPPPVFRKSTQPSVPDVIPIHPDFTAWVLANRPGRLFHGNDFHSEIGDCFSSHVVPNPDRSSEIKLLQSYAPSLDTRLVTRIADAFSELRKLFEASLLTYPYSTREAVAIVKHMHQYPHDDEVIVLHNVLDLDTFDVDTYKKLGEVFRKHGFKFDLYEKWKNAAGKHLTVEYVGDRSQEGTSSSPPPLSGPKEGKWDEKNEAHVGGNQWQGGTGGSDTAGLGGRGGPVSEP